MVTYDAYIRMDELTALIRGHSDQATPVHFRFFKDYLPAGELNSEDGKFEITVGAYEDWEVLDRDPLVQRWAFPARWTLYWTEITSTVYYRIDELVSAVWTERARVYDFGQGHFSWLTGPLEDTTPYQFRFVPVLAGDLEAAAISFSATMVRRPDPPAVTYSYSQATGNITINAA